MKPFLATESFGARNIAATATDKAMLMVLGMAACISKFYRLWIHELEALAYSTLTISFLPKKLLTNLTLNKILSAMLTQLDQTSPRAPILKTLKKKYADPAKPAKNTPMKSDW